MKSTALTTVLILSFCTVFSQGKVFTTKEGAIRGYDPVSYFTDGKPVKGSPSFTFQWKGATWYFVSQEHLDRFKTNPGQYAPQYGGYCAYGTSNGYKATTEPSAWTIVNNKLYLNYNLDVRKDWNANQAAFIQKADANWVTLEDEKE